MNDILEDLLIVIIKKLNFIEILESICLMLYEGNNSSLKKEEILNNIESFLNSKGLESENKDHFLKLVMAILAFYDFDDLYEKNLSKMFIIIESLKIEAQNMFNSFIDMLKSREEMVYKLVYQRIMRDLNNGNSIYEIMLSFKSTYAEVLQEFKNSGSIISFDISRLEKAFNELKKNNGDENPGRKGK